MNLVYGSQDIYTVHEQRSCISCAYMSATGIDFSPLDIVAWADLVTIDLALLSEEGGDVKLAAQLEDALRGYGTGFSSFLLASGFRHMCSTL